jgi:hypothetical protein
MIDHTKPHWLSRWRTPTPQPPVDEEIKARIDATAADLEAAGASVADPIPPNTRPLGLGLSEQERADVEAHIRDEHIEATPDPEAATIAARKKMVDDILDWLSRR